MGNPSISTIEDVLLVKWFKHNLFNLLIVSQSWDDRDVQLFFML